MPVLVIRVAILARDGVANAGLGMTLDILAAANRIAAGSPRPRATFAVEVLAVTRRHVATATGHRMQGDAVISDWKAKRGDIVVVPGITLPTPREMIAALEARETASVTEWLAAQWRAGATLAASCSATFLLAEAGLLDKKEATTSWFLAPLFRSRYSRVKLRSDHVLTRDGRLMCAGAAHAQADLTLAIVRERLGDPVADLCRRYLLLDERSSQTPYIHVHQFTATDPDLAAAEAWVRKNLAREFAIPDLARALALGPRTLARRIERAAGVSPIAFVQRIRAETALDLLRTAGLAFEEVAAQVGYRNAGALRRILRRETGRRVREIRGEKADQTAKLAAPT
ncbi:MAG: GlxA family transcriptional regulator [Candidatus Binatia bacterium]